VGEVLEGRVGGLVHGDGGLAEGEDQNLIEVGEGNGRVGEGEGAGVTVEMAVDGAANVDVAHGFGEDGPGLLGERTHAASLGMVDGPGWWAEREESWLMAFSVRGKFNTGLAMLV
jgi:hypothetical protein